MAGDYSRTCWGLMLAVAFAAPAFAQDGYPSHPRPLPTPLPASDIGPPAVSGWPAEELLPDQVLAEDPTIPALVDDVSPAEEATAAWYDPRWLFPGKFSGGAELGLNGSDGNSEALSLKTGFNFKHETDWDELDVNLAYNKATADGVETQHNSQFNANYERSIKDSRWNMFVRNSLLYDEFKPFDLRYAINAGVGYTIIKTETTKWKTRFGAGGSMEIGGPDDDWVKEAVFGTDFEKQLSDRQKFTFTGDYFPDWTDFENYRVVTQASYEILLNEEHNLNLKLSLNDQYDSTPNGAKPNDIFYSMVLLWKM